MLKNSSSYGSTGRMRLVDVSVSIEDGATRLTGVVERDQPHQRYSSYFRYPTSIGKISVEAAADAFAAALLLPAMRAGETLDIETPISPRLAFSLHRARDIFHTWWPQCARVDINATVRVSSPLRAKGAATFFSGGVDSFYTLLKYRKGYGHLPVPLSHIIFMRGIETRLDEIQGIDTTEEWVRKISDAVGVECIVGQSDVRTRLQGSEHNLAWEQHYHGSALAAVGLSLSDSLAYVCIPSAFTYNYLIAHGSNPLTDEMYSTENLFLVHDGSESTRADKVERIVTWEQDLVLNHLRVCNENAGGASNCGKCAKCVRTAIPLYILGLWDRARTFPDKSIDHWEKVVASERHLEFAIENLEFAQKHGDKKMTAMLTRALKWSERREKIMRLLAKRLRLLIPLAIRVKPSSDRLRALASSAATGKPPSRH